MVKLRYALQHMVVSDKLSCSRYVSYFRIYQHLQNEMAEIRREIKFWDQEFWVYQSRKSKLPSVRHATSIRLFSSGPSGFHLTGVDLGLSRTQLTGRGGGGGKCPLAYIGNEALWRDGQGGVRKLS